MTEQYVLEWSASQQCFHIQPLDAALEANRRRFGQRPVCPYDWVPMFIGAYDECEAVARHNERKLERMQPMESLRWTH